MVGVGAEGLEGGGEGREPAGIEEGDGGDFEDDAVVEAVVDEQLDEAAPGDGVVDEGLVVAGGGCRRSAPGGGEGRASDSLP